MARKAAVGISDFRKLIEGDYFYVDKTNFIKDWWENGDEVTLVNRPRRFGKTLALKMVEQFFSITAPNKGLFKNLAIWRDETYRKLQGSYPVVFFSLSLVKEPSFAAARKKICLLLTNLYSQNRFLMKEGFLEGEDALFFQRVSIGMDDVDASMALYQLSGFLSRYYQKKVLILFDEYDTPMHEAYSYGYWEEWLAFIRNLFGATFKDNPYLERALLTGITRVSKESLFSDFNNLEVVSATSKKYEAAFGFTEQEVFAALEEFGLQGEAEEVKLWYDGFRFGDASHIYNPWSVVKFLSEKEFAPYWANTSSNKLAGELIRKGSTRIKCMMEDLLNGKEIKVPLKEDIVFDQLGQDDDSIWSLLLASGYLKTMAVYTESRKKEYALMLTNAESIQVFEDMALGWFSFEKQNYNGFVNAMLKHQLEEMNLYMNRVACQTFSSFDSGRRPSEEAEPERFYHGFVLGLLVELAGRYVVTSNRESGFGRYDVMLEPCSVKDDGIILEFKVHNKQKEKNLEDTAKSAIRQILDRKYEALLEAKGVCREKIRVYGFAFEGKRVFIDGGFLRIY